MSELAQLCELAQLSATLVSKGGDKLLMDSHLKITIWINIEAIKVSAYIFGKYARPPIPHWHQF